MNRILLSILSGIMFCLYSFGQADNTRIPYNKILKNIKQIVSKDWIVFKDSADVIHIKQLDSSEICNFINADKCFGESWEDYIKNKIIGKILYEMEIKIIEKLPETEIKTIEDRNDSINSALFYLPEKFHIDNLPIKFDDYFYHTEIEKQNVLKYQEERSRLMALYKKVPDITTNLYSVYFSDKMPWYASLCNTEVEAKVQDMKKKIENFIWTIE